MTDFNYTCTPKQNESDEEVTSGPQSQIYVGTNTQSENVSRIGYQMMETLIPKRNPCQPAHHRHIIRHNRILRMPFRTLVDQISWLNASTQSQLMALNLGQEIIEFTKYVMVSLSIHSYCYSPLQF